jgi:DNA-binding NarL/FixJ family response regulator
MNGIDALEEIIRADPSAYVIMLTTLNTLDSVKKCITNSAKEYLLKENPMDKLSHMIETIIKNYVKQTNPL